MKRMKHISENRLDYIKRSKDADKYWEELFEEMSENEKRTFFRYLEHEEDVFNPKNQNEMRRSAKKRARAKQKKMIRKAQAREERARKEGKG